MKHDDQCELASPLYRDLGVLALSVKREPQHVASG